MVRHDSSVLLFLFGIRRVIRPIKYLCSNRKLSWKNSTDVLKYYKWYSNKVDLSIGIYVDGLYLLPTRTRNSAVCCWPRDEIRTRRPVETCGFRVSLEFYWINFIYFILCRVPRPPPSRDSFPYEKKNPYNFDTILVSYRNCTDLNTNVLFCFR